MAQVVRQDRVAVARGGSGDDQAGQTRSMPKGTGPVGQRAGQARRGAVHGKLDFVHWKLL